jgi:hypothetical protein
MRITERRLRRMISNIISEMSPMLSRNEMVGHEMSSFMDKAVECCRMPIYHLFDMCAQICSQNPDQAIHCAELCICACRGDKEGCCRCLSEICKCSHCAQICADCCGC